MAAYSQFGAPASGNRGTPTAAGGSSQQQQQRLDSLYGSLGSRMIPRCLSAAATTQGGGHTSGSLGSRRVRGKEGIQRTVRLDKWE